MDEQRIKYLFERYTGQSATRPEIQEWDECIRDGKSAEQIKRLMDNIVITENDADIVFPLGSRERMLASILTNTRPKQPKFKWLYAAAGLLIAATTAYFLMHQNTPQTTRNTLAENIRPLQKGVTLNNGRQVMQLRTGYQGQVLPGIRQQGGVLTYTPVARGESLMQTLTNNSNQKFNVVLSDGSEAVLDIGSSLTYPSFFVGNTRKVLLKGQAYFKVSHIAGQPFFVQYRDVTTEDIGTEFNIDAYLDMSKTTLVEGAIKVNGILLKPGEQAVTSGKHIDSAPADLEEVTAWLQNRLVFHHEKLETIMLSVARIYGVKIVWQDEQAKALSYGGSVSRSDDLSKVLNYFRAVGRADFHVDGNTVSVFLKR